MSRPILRDAATDAFDRRLVHMLSATLRTAEFHERNNTVAVEMIDGLYGALRERTETLGATTVSTRNRHVFVDGECVRMGASDFLNLTSFIKTLDAWSVGSVTMLPGLSREELTSFVYCVARGRRGGDLVALEKRLAHDNVKSVELGAPIEEGYTDDPEALPIRTYGSCLDVLGELHSAIIGNRQIRTRRVRRVTQSVVDQMLRDEYALLALTTIKRFDDHLFAHSTNVAVLSVALGQRLGLQKSQLGELCLAAFLHDLGKIAVSKDILNKPGILDDHEREEINQHPIHSVHILLNQGHLSQSTLRAIIGGFEHHVNFDMSGYPLLTQKRGLTLFGRIITLTDRYDAISTPRVYREHSFTPHQAVRHVIEHAGTQFDPDLVGVFVRMIGLYPPGTVVGLSSGDVAVSIQPARPEDPIDRPTVRIIRGNDIGVSRDLSDTDENGGHVLSVVGVYNPGNEGLYPAMDPKVLAHF
ncbi:MAG: HD domain-containing protein [Actinobacteria bacterium]|nr:HD domain-containing protein [Actinomycetota bacterium]